MIIGGAIFTNLALIGWLSWLLGADSKCLLAAPGDPGRAEPGGRQRSGGAGEENPESAEGHGGMVIVIAMIGYVKSNDTSWYILVW